MCDYIDPTSLTRQSNWMPVVSKWFNQKFELELIFNVNSMMYGILNS